MLEIRLLGEQLIAGGEKPGGRPPSSRSVALLAYLVLHAGTDQPRQRLAGIFWPDSTESQARTNLRRELHELRSLLGQCPSLVVQPTTLCWCDSPSCRVDVRVFNRERRSALSVRSGERGGDGDEFLRHAEAALAEYQGELMPGVYDDWVLDPRDRLRRECVELFDLTTRAWCQCGDHGRAITAARRRIQLEPLEEVGYRLLMETQAESGDRAAAMATYHRCASMLEQELGVSPDPATTRVLERLLERGDTPVRQHRPPGRRRRRHAAGPVLVGRERELAVLVQRWQQATFGRCGLVVVSGEAGMGKSRLVAELSAEAQAHGAVVAATRCFALSGRLALAPVAEWLRSSDLRVALAPLEPVWHVEVQRLLPDTQLPDTQLPDTQRPQAATGGNASRAVVDAWQRHRFFEGLAHAVLSADRPTLLVLDDLQWCDPETMAWLAFLVGFAKDAPLLVAATLRTEELHNNHDVAVALRSLHSAELVTEIALSPLDAGESAELAAHLLPRPLAGSEQAVLHAATGGNPFLLLEAARSLSDLGGSVEPLQIADLQTVLRRRLAQPSLAAQEVAGLAAAVGRDFSLDLLSEASDLDADMLVHAVDELWHLRILREQRSGYDFCHDLLRDAAYTMVSPARRWLLHRRLAQGLELLHAGHLDDVAAPLAEQYHRGGRPDRALHYYSRAAHVATGVFANTEALIHYRRCLDLVEQLPAGRDRDDRELDVLRQMSAPLNALRGYSSPELLSTLERSAFLAERLGHQQLLAGNLVALFSARFVQGRTALAHELGGRALALAEKEGDPDLLGQAHFAFAGSATSLGMPATAIPHFQLAYELCRGAVSYVLGTRIEVHARGWAAHAHWLYGDDDQANALCLDAVRRARAVDHPYTLAVGLAYAAITQQVRGDTATLVDTIEELRALCQRYEFAYYGEWATILDGWVSGGDLGVARIQEGIDRLRSQGAYARMPYWLSLLADLLAGCGRTEAAQAVLDAAWAAAEERDDRWWLPEVLRRRAQLEPTGQVVAILQRAVDLAEQQQSRTLESRCRADLLDRASGTPPPVRRLGKADER